MPKKIHAGYLAEVAVVRKELWKSLAGCRIHHANHGLGTLLPDEGSTRSIRVRFDKDVVAIGYRSLYNGQTLIELPPKLMRLLATDIEQVDTAKVDRFHIDLLRAKGRQIALEKRKEKKKGSSKSGKLKAAKKAKARKKSKAKSKSRPKYQDMMTRGNRLPGSYGTGKRR